MREQSQFLGPNYILRPEHNDGVCQGRGSVITEPEKGPLRTTMFRDPSALDPARFSTNEQLWMAELTSG